MHINIMTSYNVAMTAKQIAAYAQSHEQWLMRRTLDYAKKHKYAQLTSTLEEAWRASIVGLTAGLTKMAGEHAKPAELSPNEDYLNDATAAFGIEEAKLHRSRGLTMTMFLGLMKYYRQSYLDLIDHADFTETDKAFGRTYLNRFFDRVELGFVSEWAALTPDQAAADLQNRNRKMTMEKNRYLTVFESVASPLILLKPDLTVRNMNHAAALLFHGQESPGRMYYQNGRRAGERVAWLEDELTAFDRRGDQDFQFEKDLTISTGVRTFQVNMSRMLDVSEIFTGIIVTLNDVTDKVKYEKRLSFYAEHDHLTGLYNRRVLENSVKRTVERAKKKVPAAFLYLDVDNLKAVNDNCGHADGDRLLEAVAKIVRANTRPEDIAARLGGDEFAILLNQTEKEAAVEIAERIRGSMPDAFDRCADFNIGISIGVVTIDGSHDYLSVISRADQAMYRAKQAGRNRVIVD